MSARLGHFGGIRHLFMPTGRCRAPLFCILVPDSIANPAPRESLLHGGLVVDRAFACDASHSGNDVAIRWKDRRPAIEMLGHYDGADIDSANFRHDPAWNGSIRFLQAPIDFVNAMDRKIRIQAKQEFSVLFQGALRRFRHGLDLGDPRTAAILDLKPKADSRKPATSSGCRARRLSDCSRGRIGVVICHRFIPTLSSRV